MLFRKNIEKACCYCTHSCPKDEDTVLCKGKKEKDPYDHCLLFQYDPTKRVPSKPKALDFEKYEEYDYSL